MAANAEGYRGDVDGLRAVAIVAVVAFHAGIAGFGGGFVGVDVFFVISGFLITRQLVDELADRGRVGLAGFWARRVRRLVPSLALLVVVTLIASSIVLAPVDVREAGRQGLAAGLYVSNLMAGWGSSAVNHPGASVRRMADAIVHRGPDDEKVMHEVPRRS